MSAPPKRRLTAEERRTGILDSALAVFSESGYHSASIDDIAREAGVSKALIYEHFASKQELYADLIARNARELTQRIGAALVGVELDSGAARLAVGLDAFFAFVEERRDAWRMLFREVADPETAAVLDRMLEQVTAEVTVLISQDPGATCARQRRGPAGAAAARRDARGRHAVDGELVELESGGAPPADGRDRHGLRLARARAAEPRRALARLNELRRRRRRLRGPLAPGARRDRRDGERREISFGEVADRSARLAGALAARGVGRGDVVMTVVGNRPEWAYAMLACWRLGAVAQPCTEQLRPADLRARMEMVDPRAVVADARDLELVTASGFDGPVLAVPDEALFDATPAAGRASGRPTTPR